MVTTESTAGISRVLTQNLIISAVEAEHSDRPFDSSVEDLAALIDATVLYDGLVVLGRSKDFHHFGPSSDLISLLQDEEIISSRTLTPEESQKVAATARCHLATYLGSDQIDRFDGLLRHALTPEQAEYGLVSRSDNVPKPSKTLMPQLECSRPADSTNHTLAEA